MSIITEPNKIMKAWAKDGLRTAIPANSNLVTGRAGYSQGFTLTNMKARENGGVAPFGTDINGIFYDITTILRYMQAGGQPTYDALFSFNLGEGEGFGGSPRGAKLISDDGKTTYVNRMTNNVSNPNTIGTGWVDDNAFALAALKRAYLKDGYTLIDGSFEKGATLTNNMQILFQEKTKKVFRWNGAYVSGKKVIDGSGTLTPKNTGGIASDAWIDVTSVFAIVTDWGREINITVGDAVRYVDGSQDIVFSKNDIGIPTQFNAAQGNADIVAGGFAQVGTYIFARCDMTHDFYIGDTTAGSNLRPCSVDDESDDEYDPGLSGTWKCLGRSHYGTLGESEWKAAKTIWIRIV